MHEKKDFTEKLADYRARVDHSLNGAIRASNHPAPLLRDAMLYATLNGGKRLRPILIYATGESFGQTPEALDYAAAAMECMHCCSLIHDDLPAMDDDLLRRGKPTCHIAFDEATAILAGDALQTLAFELLASSDNSHLSAEIKIRLIQTLALHAGATGMIGGQSLDLLAEGKNISSNELEHIHRLKTGALIRASIVMGVLASECTDEILLGKYDIFATHIGLAFQLQDDLLDITGNSQKLGKNTGQDIKLQKATYAALFGIEKTILKITSLMEDAQKILQQLPQNTSFLKKICDYLIQREN